MYNLDRAGPDIDSTVFIILVRRHIIFALSKSSTKDGRSAFWHRDHNLFDGHVGVGLDGRAGFGGAVARTLMAVMAMNAVVRTLMALNRKPSRGMVPS